MIEQGDYTTAGPSGKFFVGMAVGAGLYGFVAVAGTAVYEDEPIEEPATVNQRAVQNVVPALAGDAVHNIWQVLGGEEYLFADDIFVTAGAYAGYSLMREGFRYAHGIEDLEDVEDMLDGEE